MIKLYKEAISKYKKSVEGYQDIFEQQMKCEKLINLYFSLQKNINLSNEPNEIKNYKKTFNAAIICYICREKKCPPDASPKQDSSTGFQEHKFPGTFLFPERELHFGQQR